MMAVRRGRRGGKGRQGSDTHTLYYVQSSFKFMHHNATQEVNAHILFFYTGNLNLNEFPHLVAFIIIRLLKDSHSILKVEVREKRVHSSSSCDESKNHRPLKKSKIGEDIIERLFAELRQQEALTNSVESCDEITKSRENKTDKNCRNDHNDANAKIEYLRGVFTNNKFDPACHQVFAQIDQDKSGRIDACEFANAFYIVISHIPGAIERLKQCGVDCSDGVVASSITSELVKVVFGELNIDIQNGRFLCSFVFVFLLYLCVVVIMSMCVAPAYMVFFSVTLHTCSIMYCMLL